ncbi:uncharacterized protein LOC133185038 [Saccostrea echinata]|uniref:uncharacterized protein LOC133185038 n=1 Tax=Saccostrea echinata TaxID=191078 RepID=UPI002A83B986|nr:uncharacterized protein LOC133185038 [Saccostrea echinata]
MSLIKHTSDANQAYLRPFSSISCGTEVSGVTKRTTTASQILQFSCTEITGTQLVQSNGEYNCLPCFPGNYLNVTKCEACPVGQYQSEAGQLTCDNCTTGKHVTEDRRECKDSACVLSFLSQSLPNATFSCDAQTQTCISSCISGYIQDDGGQSTISNCSTSNGWHPPSKNCIKYEFSTYWMDLEIVYETEELPASYCLSDFRSVTYENTVSFNTTISSSCNLHSTGGVVIENITSTTKAFQKH